MSSMAGHLVRRGFEAHSSMSEGKVKIDIPAWGIMMLATTAIIFVGVLFFIDYTFGRIVPTLLMIESPQDNINFEPLPTEDTDNSINKDPEPVVSRASFITSSFRETTRLLRAKGGFRGRFRGFWIFVVHATLVQWIGVTLASLPLLRFIPIGFTTVIAYVLCAQLSLGWTLIVISEPSPKSWFRRLPTLKMWKKIAGPTALYAVAEQSAVMLPLYLSMNCGLMQNPNEVANMPDREARAMAGKSIGIFILGLVLMCFVVIPANVILTRVQASLIQDAEETIVPFDRSFGGKVVPEIVGGTGMIGILDAWKTFNWSARIRLIKTYLKVVALQIGATLFFTVLFICQILMVGGFNKIIVPADGKN